MFDLTKLSYQAELFGQRKYVNLVPLTEEEITVARLKRKRILSQRRFIQDFLFYSVCLVVLFMIIYYDGNDDAYNYKSAIEKLFAINKNFTSVGLKVFINL